MASEGKDTESRLSRTKCPECHAPLGPGTGTDIYKHAINCFHLPDKGPTQLLQELAGKKDTRSRRISELLTGL